MNVNARLKTLFEIGLAAFLIVLSNVPTRGQNSREAKVTIEGQFVCSQCWFEADRKTTPYGTAADIECAKDCAQKGIPSAIAVKEQDSYRLYIVEEGQFKKPGKDWLVYIGKQVRISGPIHEKKEKLYVQVDALNVISSPEANAPDSIIGSQAELVLKDLFGVEQTIGSLRNRLVILNFWATWCVPCRKEMPDLAGIQNAYAAFGLQVVGASADPIEDRTKVIQFVKDLRINFPVWIGATTVDMRRLGVGPGLPATVIIGRDGKILAVHRSVIRQNELKKQIDQLLGSASADAGRAQALPRSRDVSLVPS